MNKAEWTLETGQSNDNWNIKCDEKIVCLVRRNEFDTRKGHDELDESLSSSLIDAALIARIAKNVTAVRITSLQVSVAVQRLETVLNRNSNAIRRSLN
jgi:hypothetical protein